ncbi:NlpC/P60 family protein [Phnomibacter sp. MR]|uniref:C40 family peptidase n=1 Tax=Phnomibacter sp. MR TaxID=3042318 RepID=UPI003A7F7D2A
MMCINIVSVAPMRAQAAHRSEMVSQLLFGEQCEILNSDGDFYLVRSRYDGYEGWVQATQLVPIEAGLFDESMVCTAPLDAHVWVNDRPLRLSPGSECYFPASGRGKVNREALALPGYNILYHHPLPLMPLEPTTPNSEAILTCAMQYLGTPYLWGGKSIWGIDCSGFVQMVFKQNGMFVPRDAWQQAEGGDAIGFLQEAKPGDLAFFDNAEGRITHVGIMLNDYEILHASGVVRIDPIDNEGIIHAESGRRTHHLRLLKRYF